MSGDGPSRAGDLSVVIPVHDNASTIVTQLEAVVGSRADVEVVVVDNRSTDGSAAVVSGWARAAGADVTVAPAHERAGEPYARNVGVAAASGTRIAFCDGDDAVTPTWVDAMDAALAAHDYVTGPVRFDALNPVHLAGVRGLDLTERPSLLYGVIPYANGCNMGFRRRTLDDLGGFDETFLTGCDVEIAIRAWRRGVPLHFCADAAVDYRLRHGLAAYRQGRSYGRIRARFRAAVPGLVDPRAERRANVRRLAWLLRRAPAAAVDPATRARWSWVAAQLDGELRAAVSGWRS